MTITPQTAERPLKCRGCMGKGEDEPTIQPWEEYFLMEHNNQRDCCCAPCFERLQKALEEMEPLFV